MPEIDDDPSSSQAEDNPSSPEGDDTPEFLEVESPPLEEEEVEDPFAVESDPVIKSPVLLSRPRPRYPAAAMRLKKTAEVILRLLIDPNGKVIDVERVGEDPGMGFSKAAINAALAGDSKEVSVPPPFAIAHHLIRAWVERDFGGEG